MGIFDEIRCCIHLPHLDVIDERWFQTKSFYPASGDRYEIRPDHTLWREEFDIEDQSDPNSDSLMGLAGMLARVNKRWVQADDYIGEVRFYDAFEGDNGWMEFSAYVFCGHLKELHLVELRRS